jgi:hypothetical protein
MSNPDRHAGRAARRSTYGAEATYGTWGNKDPIGLHYDLEAHYESKALRCTDVDAADFGALNTFVTANNAWSITNNGASFASRGWRAVTGESLSSGTIVSTLAASIAVAGDTLSPVSAGRGRSSW